MVEIVPDSFKPVANSLLPSIQFIITETVQENTMLLNVEGQILTEDDKIAANFVEISREPKEGRLAIRGITEYLSYGDIKHKSHVVFTLDKRAIDHIEDVRQKNSKRDVVLKVKIRLTFLGHDLRLGDYKTAKIPQGEVILRAYNEASRADGNLNIITTSQSGSPQALFRYSTAEITLPYTIKSSDWVSDFQIPLGIGKFLIVEIPTVDPLSLDKLVLNEEQKRFKERLDKAITMLPKIEEDLRRGEWGDVVKESRELLELFRKDVTKFIKQIISQTTSLSEEGAGSFTMAIDNQYAYANDLHHTVDKNGAVKEVFTGGKRDAYSAYNYAAMLVNQLSEKFSIVVRNNQPK